MTTKGLHITFNDSITEKVLINYARLIQQTLEKDLSKEDFKIKFSTF